MKFSTTLLTTALLITPALSGPISLVQDAGTFAVRKILSTFMNSTQVDKVLTKEVMEPHPFVMDLTDDNWEVALRTGSDDPFGKPLEDVIWVITVYGPDNVSKMMLKASDATARYNSSAAGGELPSDMRFARIDYSVETILPSLFNLWKVPVVVIASNNMQDLRFFKVPYIAPFHYQMSHLLNNRTLWETMPIWQGALAPGGSLEPYLHKIAKLFATYHSYMQRIPTFVLLAISGAIMNIVVSWFHSGDKNTTTTEIVAPSSTLSKEERRAALKAKWAQEVAEGKRQPTVIDGENIGVEEVKIIETKSEKSSSSEMKKRNYAVSYYKDLNPSTLSGAIDVIVVERKTEDGGIELACSPFHVRFGKLSVLRPIDKKVRITVNDVPIDFNMKVGETGEAFFVFETDADVPEDLQTSPLAGPIPDEEMEGLENNEEDIGEPEFLDLAAAGPDDNDSTDPEADEDDDDARRYSIDSSTTGSSRYASMNPTHPSSPTPTIRTLPSMTRINTTSSASAFDIPTQDNGAFGEPETTYSSPSEGNEEGMMRPFGAAAFALSTAEKAASLGKLAMTSVTSGLGDKKLKDLVKLQGGRSGSASKDLNGGGVDSEEGQGQSAAALELGELERGMKEDLAGLSLSEKKERDASNFVGEEVREAAREKNADIISMLGAKEAHQTHRESLSDDDYRLGSFLRKGSKATDGYFGAGPEGAIEQTGDLMLDMSGYKIEEDDSEKNGSTADEGLGVPTEINEPFDEASEREIVAFTQGLLQSIDPRTLRGLFDPSDSTDADSSRGSSPLPGVNLNLYEDGEKPSKLGSGRLRVTSDVGSTRPTSLSSLQSLHAESELESLPDDGVINASPTLFSLRVGGKIHVFELSLCGGDDFGHDRTRDDEAFAKEQLTFTKFLENDDITNESNLVVKYAGRYLTWDNASPVLASLAVYRKSLVDHPEHHRYVDQSEVDLGKRSSRGWSLWWNRKGAAAGSTVSLPTRETSPPTSPPFTRPASPISLPPPNLAEVPSAAATPEPVEKDNRHYAKTLRLTSDQLKTLGLKKGKNVISFSVRSSFSGYATCTSRIFLWEQDFQVVISDIDGTITKSDALGHVFTMIGRDWTHIGVAKLYTDIARNGYKMMYLTSRAIGQADTTREYLKGIKQNGYQLPEGPVIMSPDRLMTSLHREVVLRKPEVFKMACLRDIHRLFHGRSPFCAGFGNRITDALSYRSVEIPSSRIFTIDTNGEVKMELLELAGYKSSYIHMTDLVDQMFPPINTKTAPAFTDFNFWRAPVAQFDFPDLSPPSPALSARSEGSSRLPSFPRLGSLASSLSRRSSRQTLTEPSSPTNNRSARAASPSSPLLQATVVEGEDEEDDDRSESESMPGSLPTGSDFERLRAAALRNRNGGYSAAEAYKDSVRDDDDDGDYDSEEEEDREDEDGGDDFEENLDFSSVPY